MRDRLLESEEITRQELDDLASARTAAVKSAFISEGAFDENRVVVAAPSEVESDDGEWIVMGLGVSAD